MLFVGSLLVLSFARLSSVNPGFATSDVLLVSLEPVQRVDPQRAARGAAPGARSAAAMSRRRGGELRRVQRARPCLDPQHSATPGREQTIESTMTPVTPGFFETMRIPVLAGRAFVRRDMGDGNAPRRSSSTRRSRGPTSAREPAVGRTARRRASADNDDAGSHEVVGVVADTRVRPAQAGGADDLHPRCGCAATAPLHVRVAGDPAALTARLREEIRAATPLFRVTTVTSQAAAVDQTLIRERLLALLVRLLRDGRPGAGRRRPVRRAELLGRAADARDRHSRRARRAPAFGVVRTVLAEAGGAALVGSRRAAWPAGSIASRFVETLLFEVTPLDFWSLALPLGTLLLAALLAAALPALRAARVDPVIALRYE